MSAGNYRPFIDFLQNKERKLRLVAEVWAKQLSIFYCIYNILEDMMRRTLGGKP